ncbi:hypothetical protein S83_060664 [Arachis hypogaea]
MPRSILQEGRYDGSMILTESYNSKSPSSEIRLRHLEKIFSFEVVKMAASNSSMTHHSKALLYGRVAGSEHHFCYCVMKHAVLYSQYN